MSTNSWVLAAGSAPTEAHILAAVRALNRIELVGETLRHVLNDLAVVAPDWLRALSPPAWVERDARRAEDDRLPTSKDARAARALTIGADGALLLTAVYAPAAPPWLCHVPAVETLRRVWVQNYYCVGAEEESRVRWRTDDQGIPPASLFVSSPYNPDAK